MMNAAQVEVFPPGPFASADGRTPATREQQAILDKIERLAKLMDSSINIPGLNRSIGADGILGLVLPGVGDALAAGASVYIVVQAKKLGLPNSKLARMMVNIVIDTGVGAVPLAGDIFDFAMKANLMNVDIVREHFNLPPLPRNQVKDKR
ncbi:DUF4112 domain-containing protein [Luteolibacter sp. Populi]|uniref:DUF4112 domain-containing protein n=1 Tax=Luteolibacter sp. Populi TaxID=3230487 RepID=UPI00346769AE